MSNNVLNVEPAALFGLLGLGILPPDILKTPVLHLLLLCHVVSLHASLSNGLVQFFSLELVPIAYQVRVAALLFDRGWLILTAFLHLPLWLSSHHLLLLRESALAKFDFLRGFILA